MGEYMGAFVEDDDYLISQPLLRNILRLLASRADDQLAYYRVVNLVTEEMANDFESSYAIALGAGFALTPEQHAVLTTIHTTFHSLSGHASGGFWKDEALVNDPRWEEIRHLALRALTLLGWTFQVLAPERWMGHPDLPEMGS